MPEVRDKAIIRSALSVDRIWGAYALGDLDDALFADATWFMCSKTSTALALLYTGFSTPIIYMQGKPPEIQSLLSEVDSLQPLHFTVKEEALAVMAQAGHITKQQTMLRMVLNSAANAQTNTAATRLGARDIPAIKRLYQDGASSGEAPDFVSNAMIENGIYFGVVDGVNLLAVAGTHLVVPDEGVAAIGGVYTRRDKRGCGLAKAATSAVVSTLAQKRIETIVLNVRRSNTAAISVYESLGFGFHCQFFEGEIKQHTTPLQLQASQ